jgi:cytochrome c biogenesis protein
MKFFPIKQGLKIISDLYFAIFLLILIALSSSLGSFIEQDETINFYQENYAKPIFGFITSSFILNFGLDHVYTTGWFFFLLILFGISLLSCTVKRQFPLLIVSKEFFFKKKKNSFVNLAFSFQIQSFYYFQELLLTKMQNLDFFLYQKRKVIYGYKGLLGRISPILVHFSLIIILFGACIGAFFNFKVQEIFPKGETFHIQNPIRVGLFSSIPQVSIRVNDFWAEYENNRIHQFYSNLSIVDNFGKEKKEQTISVNHPLRYQNLDFYQSDWNLLGIRIKEKISNKFYEFPLFPLKNQTKSGVTWIKENNEIRTFIIDQFENILLIYDKNGNLLGQKNVGDSISVTSQFIIGEILSSTGLLIKSDPSLLIIYTGFGLLMVTSSLSYLPYTQIWICNQKKRSWIGSSTNRGKIQLEIEFENFLRYLQYQLYKTIFAKKK